jgi:diguanylate cyclase (GGDEF)-like protein
MAEPYLHPGFAAAHLMLKGLHQQATQFKAELLRLQQQLDLLQMEGQQTQHGDLIAANQQLVLSSIHAEQELEQVKSHVGELTRSSQRDALTDTPNRTLMLDRIARSISYARRHHRQLALIFLDLDHFKQINDSMGHQTGDDVLKLVTRRLSHVLRDSDTISRHGGDEFLILLSAIDSDEAVAAIAEKILQALAAPVIFSDIPLNISASLGIAFYPLHGTEATQLIQAADDAMYQSKRRGGSCFSIYSADSVSQHNGHAANFSGFIKGHSFLVRAMTHRQSGRQRPY